MFKQEKKYNADLSETLKKKQERYIKREQEYRKTIEEIKEDIVKRSTNPFNIDGDEFGIDIVGAGVPAHPAKSIPSTTQNLISDSYKHIMSSISNI